MAEAKKISDFPAATVAAGGELLGIQGGVTKRFSADLLGGSGGSVTLYSGNPSAPDVAYPGNSQQAARGDHVHPRDGGKMDAPGGTKSAGKVPTVQNDGTTVQWADPPAGGGGGASLSSSNPVANGTAAPGVSTSASRSDHVHPTDTTRLANPTGTKAAGMVPLVGIDGVAVAWSVPPTDTSRMANPTGTKATGKVPMVAGDGSTVSWQDPPTGTALVLGANKLTGTDAQGNVTALRGSASIGQEYVGAPPVNEKLVLAMSAPWPGTVDAIATAVEGSSTPSVTIAVEKVTLGTGGVLGGLSALVCNSGARDNPTKASVTGTRAFAAGDAIRVTVTAVSGTVTRFAVELTLNRLAG